MNSSRKFFCRYAAPRQPLGVTLVCPAGAEIELVLAAHTLRGISVHSGKSGLRNKEVSHRVWDGCVLYSLAVFGASGSALRGSKDRN
jgi:hypothetical protein